MTSAYSSSLLRTLSAAELLGEVPIPGKSVRCSGWFCEVDLALANADDALVSKLGEDDFGGMVTSLGGRLSTCKAHQMS